MQLTTRKKRGSNKGAFITLLLFAVIVLVFLLVLNSVSMKSEEQQAASLENAVRRAVVTCFAIEGRYPPSLSYLADNYGMKTVLDNDRYIVSYSAFASNVFPDIAVLKVGVDQ